MKGKDGWMENEPFSMLGVSDRISDNILEEDLEHSTGFFVDEAADTFDTTTTSETTDGLVGELSHEARDGE